LAVEIDLLNRNSYIKIIIKHIAIKQKSPNSNKDTYEPLVEGLGLYSPGHIPITGRLSLDSLPSLAVLPSYARGVTMARREKSSGTDSLPRWKLSGP
jgi:hypothetical protein